MCHLPYLSCLRKIEWWKLKSFTDPSNEKTRFFHGSTRWNFDRVFFLSIFISKPQQLYLTLIFKRNLSKRFSFRSLILTLVLIIFTTSYTWNYAQKMFYENFLCLKVFEVNLKLCHYNWFLRPGANLMWSKHWFDWYMDCRAIERYASFIWKKLQQKLCRKKNLMGNGEWLSITG